MPIPRRGLFARPRGRFPLPGHTAAAGHSYPASSFRQDLQLGLAPSRLIGYIRPARRFGLPTCVAHPPPYGTTSSALLGGRGRCATQGPREGASPGVASRLPIAIFEPGATPPVPPFS